MNFLKWQRSGTQGDEWKRGLVPLSTASTRSRIVFEAVRGVSYSGDIAIDDVSILSGACPPPGMYNFLRKTLVFDLMKMSFSDDFLSVLPLILQKSVLLYLYFTYCFVDCLVDRFILLVNSF